MISTRSKVFYTSFFLRIGGETRLFFLQRRRIIPGEKPGFFPVRISKTYG
ncbi:Uncharacterized protein dnm_067120 [Desulfonema magnum]|uniref:Uncharacterized protein n=1 Tax=Desulfonema magnum TaxID=45655 RepID=A0A975BS51_9BACT|nr:Uncharacterized protein dnm_067120 [Desulfonema magnum]